MTLTIEDIRRAQAILFKYKTIAKLKNSDTALTDIEFLIDTFKKLTGDIK